MPHPYFEMTAKGFPYEAFLWLDLLLTSAIALENRPQLFLTFHLRSEVFWIVGTLVKCHTW